MNDQALVLVLASAYTGLILMTVSWLGRRFDFSNADILIPLATALGIAPILPNPVAIGFIIVAVLITLNRVVAGGGLLRKPHPLVPIMMDLERMIPFLAGIAARAPGAMLGSDFQSVIRALEQAGARELAARVAAGMDTAFRDEIRRLELVNPAMANVIIAVYTASNQSQVDAACTTARNFAFRTLQPRIAIRFLIAAMIALLAIYAMIAIFSLDALARVGF